MDEDRGVKCSLYRLTIQGSGKRYFLRPGAVQVQAKSSQKVELSSPLSLASVLPLPVDERMTGDLLQAGPLWAVPRESKV